MSEPRIISPLLDGFKLGAPICEHHGITCCPAVRENSNKKYIVKIISVPASQSQLDALLLAGAYKDPADAMEYFRKKGESILEEAEHLKMLSKLEGFLPYDGWQMEPITRHRLGYEIYLVGSYKRSLAKYMAKTALTHLEAVNLGLDLCSALSVCRQSGYIYVDLKPSNIYVSEKKEYRIGDIGFLSLDSLRYASLPEQYYSPYVAPELLDPMTAMNLSADTYAVGMILYQIYNDGQLPFRGNAPEQPLSSPLHADYELSEIIMKAISPDPGQRWLDPKDLGKALASYMQRNSVNDIPITPFIPLDVEPEQIAPVEKKQKRKKAKAVQKEPVREELSDVAVSEDPEPVAASEISSTEALSEENSESAAGDAEISPEVLPEAEPEILAEPEVTSEEELPEESAKEQEPVPVEEESHQEIPEPMPAAADAISEDNTTDDIPQLSEDVARIINKADDLIAYQIPEEVIYPSEPEEDPFAFARDDADEIDDALYQDPQTEDEPEQATPEKKKKTKHFADQTRAKKFRRFLGGLLGTVLLATTCVCGYWFYQNIYLQPVDGMTVTGGQDQITVLIDTSVDESGLVIHCTDAKGNRVTESVKGGKVTFLNLEPSTVYTIEAEISGFHKLVGQTTETFKTESSTQILTFDAIAGSEDGSVKLAFTVEGGEPDFWNILYSADGEEEKCETITSHSTMITGLTVGKVYTFTLDGGKDFDLSGNKQLQYMASKLILAEKITASADDSSDITVQWKTPGDVVVDHWYVRWYDGYGFEDEVTVTDNQVMINGLDPEVSYKLEITASGMTQPARFDLTENPVKISSFTADDSKKTKLHVTWKYDGNEPDGGWILVYTIDGSGSQVVECAKAEADIMPLIPGATYNFTIQTADGRTVFNDTYTHTTVSAETFTDNAVKIEDLTIGLLNTPAEEVWICDELPEDIYTDTFAPGDSASIAIRSASTFYLPGYETKVLYVFRNSYGNVLPELISEETYYWKNIWTAGNPQNGELNIPKLPSAPGDYVLQLFFNGKTVVELDFHIAE